MSDTEILASWMMLHGYATGHGDDVKMLVAELDWQHRERMAWQPIETAPKDGRLVILATDYRRGGHDQVRCGFWESSSQDRWIWKDKDTQVREGRTDTSRWHVFMSFDAGCNEACDEDDDQFVRAFDPTHWMPLPEPPK